MFCVVRCGTTVFEKVFLVENCSFFAALVSQGESKWPTGPT